VITGDAARLRNAGFIAAATAVAVWGSSSVLIKAVDGVSGLGISFYRLLVGATGLTIIHLGRGGRISISFLRACFAGGIAFAIDIVLFFTAVQETTIANATIIGALQPVLVMAIASRLFGEKPRVSDGVLSVIAIVGCVIVVSGGTGAGTGSMRGDLLAVGALVAWTWYFVASKRARRGLGSFEYLTGLSIVAVIVMAPVAAIAHDSLGSPTTNGWIVIALIALINGALGHILMNWAHAHVPLVVTSLLTLAIPVFATGAAAIFLDEPISPVQLLGMFVVIGSLSVVVLHQARNPTTAPEPPVGVADVPPG
jgi:drug/metabolite transporter (DMT)-like permease